MIRRLLAAALVIAAKDLRQRIRDRSALVLGVVAPLAVAGLMSVAFSSVEDFHADIAVVDVDRGPLAAAFRQALAGPELADVLSVSSAGSEVEARDLVDRRRVGAAVVIPAGFSTAATGDAPLGITVLADPDNTVAAQVAAAVADAFVAQLNADRLAIHTALAAGVPPARTAELAAAAARLRLPESLQDRPAGFRRLATVSYYAPSMGIFFTLFAIGFTARGYFLEQRDGTLERIAAAPVGTGAILLGKSLATFGYGVVSLGTLAVLTSVAFGAYWGPPLAAAALIVAMAVMLVTLTAFVIVVSRTDRQAEGIASIVTFALVLLGGNFVLLSQAPEFLRQLALSTPNGWAMRGLTDLATGAPATSAVVPVLVILAMAGLVVLATAGLVALTGRRAVR
jgi:ABC-2 type transport system permease protein